ncbi:hypothetical protein GGX14DRAFT_546638 [Mycena pura]|uniref:Uncharacterized protein n=1 Tax=Mycena pura TaxID=153505 RepID=A0AAD6UNX0_9AGAR|nr:hypothetical protein GGX14DRAFT_546638 [Mycena pura]
MQIKVVAFVATLVAVVSGCVRILRFRSTWSPSQLVRLVQRDPSDVGPLSVSLAASTAARLIIALFNLIMNKLEADKPDRCSKTGLIAIAKFDKFSFRFLSARWTRQAGRSEFEFGIRALFHTRLLCNKGSAMLDIKVGWPTSGEAQTKFLGEKIPYAVPQTGKTSRQDESSRKLGCSTRYWQRQPTIDHRSTNKQQHTLAPPTGMQLAGSWSRPCGQIRGTAGDQPPISPFPAVGANGPSSIPADMAASWVYSWVTDVLLAG